MTGNNDDDDVSSKKLITTRGILKGIAGIGAGAGFGLGGIFGLNEYTDYIDLDAIFRRSDLPGTGPEPPDKEPEYTEPENTEPPRTTPWDKETVVVSIDWKESLSGVPTRTKRFENAIEFWNDYIEANVQFDLTLTFEPDHSDPDILFEERGIMKCFGEYDSPATNDELLTPLVCLETLRETPDETPVNAVIGPGLYGEEFYELLVKHALGRLIGFDIWTDPVDVMIPKIIFGPAHTKEQNGRSILRKPAKAAGTLEKLSEHASGALANIRETSSISRKLETLPGDLNNYVESHEEAMRQWKREPEELGFPRYVEAYDEAVKNDEIAYVKETTSLMADLAENNSDEEIRGSDELATIIERLENIRSWTSTKEMWDIQIHRAWTDAVWSDWSDE